MNRRHPPPAVLLRVLEREMGNARRGALGDDLQALDYPRYDLMLEAGIQIFSVLAHDDEVDRLKSGRDARQIPDRSQICVQVERFAKPDVDTGESVRDRRGDRSLQRDLVATNRVDQLDRQRFPGPLDRQHASQLAVPFDRHAGGVEDAHDRISHFGADTVAGDQGDRARH
jgi:hypothetical protein